MGARPARPDLTGYPVNLLVRGRRVVVVGGGRIAARKIEPLLDAGAHVEVVAPETAAEVRAFADAGRLVLHDRRSCRRCRGLRGGRGAAALGQQCRRPAELLIYADVGDPAR